MKKGYALGVLYGIALFGALMLGVVITNDWQLQGWPRIPVMLAMCLPMLVWYVHTSIGPQERQMGMCIGFLVFMPFGYLLWWLSGVPWSFYEFPNWWSYLIAIVVVLISSYCCYRYVERRNNLDTQAE